MTSQSSYRYAFLRAIIGQLINLRASNSIRDMPSMREQAQMDRVDRLRFLFGIRNRFTDTISFRRYTMDDEMARELGAFDPGFKSTIMASNSSSIARSRALNREAVEKLRFLCQREQVQMEEQCRSISTLFLSVSNSKQHFLKPKYSK